MAAERIQVQVSMDSASYEAGARRVADATERIDTSMAKVSKGSGKTGLALNALAQGLEDLQYGVGGAMNNLSQFAMLLGAGGAVITAVTLAGVAVNQLYRHWDDLFGKEVPQYADNIEEMRAELKALEDKETKVAVDFTQIDELKRKIDDAVKAKAVLDRVAGTQTEAEAASGKAIEAVLTATPANRKAILDLTKQTGKEAVRSDAAVQGLTTDFLAAQQRVKAAQQDLDRAAGPDVPVYAHRLGRAKDELAAIDRRLRTATRSARGRGEGTIGTLIEDATKGVGANQAAAREQLAGLLAGRGGAGAAIAATLRGGGQTPGDIEREKQGRENLILGLEEMRKAEADRVKQAAGMLQGGFTERTLGGGTYTKAETAQRLEEALGFTPAAAKAFSGDVLTSLQQGFTGAMRERAGKEGITEQEAIARSADELMQQREDEMQKRIDAGLGLGDAEISMLEMMRGKRQKMPTPERIAAESFARSVEAGGGRDVQKDQLDQLKEIKKGIDTMNDFQKTQRGFARLAR